jgi:hypothetical protein
MGLTKSLGVRGVNQAKKWYLRRSVWFRQASSQLAAGGGNAGCILRPRPMARQECDEDRGDLNTVIWWCHRSAFAGQRRVSMGRGLKGGWLPQR